MKNTTLAACLQLHNQKSPRFGAGVQVNLPEQLGELRPAIAFNRDFRPAARLLETILVGEAFLIENLTRLLASVERFAGFCKNQDFMRL